MTGTRRFTTYVTAALTMLAPASLWAGEITAVNWFSGIASVAGEFVDPPDSPNNDDALITDNEIFVLQKDYNGIGPVDLVFDVVNSGGVTEYGVVEGVQNNTGMDWTGYHVELGFGNGAGFTKSTPLDGLDFDTPDENSTVEFNPFPFTYFTTIARPTEDDLVAGGGDLADFEFAGDFIFHVDVPDGITSFTIRQSPIAAGSSAVPEPSAFALAGLGLLLLGFVARRRRRRA